MALIAELVVSRNHRENPMQLILHTAANQVFFKQKTPRKGKQIELIRSISSLI